MQVTRPVTTHRMGTGERVLPFACMQMLHTLSLGRVGQEGKHELMNINQKLTSMKGTTDTRFATLAFVNTVPMKAPTQVISMASAAGEAPSGAAELSSRLISPAMAWMRRQRDLNR